jgi:Methane/Phenol/Alkene Hydroxylase
MDNLGVAQYLTRVRLALDAPSVLDEGKQAWLNDPLASAAPLVEDTFVVDDPFEPFIAQNLALDGLLYPLIYGSFVDDHIALQGGTAVAMLTAFMPEWHDESARWVDAVVKRPMRTTGRSRCGSGPGPNAPKAHWRRSRNSPSGRPRRAQCVQRLRHAAAG